MAYSASPSCPFGNLIFAYQIWKIARLLPLCLFSISLSSVAKEELRISVKHSKETNLVSIVHGQDPINRVDSFVNVFVKTTLRDIKNCLINQPLLDNEERYVTRTK